MADRRDILAPPGGDAWRRTVPRAAVEDLLMLSAGLFEWRAGGEAAAMTAVRRELGPAADGPFDPTEVVNDMIVRGLRGQSDFWRTRYVATGRRLVGALCGSQSEGPPDIARLPPRRFRVALRRTFDLAHAPARRLRMPLPIEDGQLTDLQVAVEPCAADIRLEPGRLEAKVAPSARGAFTLSASVSFLAHPGLPHGLDEGLPQPQAWLAAREGPVRVTPAVATRAGELGASRRDPLDQVMAFRDHLIDTMVCGRIHLDALAGQAATDWVLAHRWFDCRLGAALLVALCRARGIPARLVGGYLLWAAPSEHYWMEAWIADRGWVPFDLLAWDLSGGGQDEAWRGVYAGALDYRMKTQVFPQVFTGAPGPPMGGAWHRLSRATEIEGETETRLVSVPDGGLIYADTVRVLKG